jgi:hypothetical protein
MCSAALESVLLDERGLERMQLLLVRQPLDGRDLGSIARDREHEAAVRAAPVEQHRAGAALPVIAPLLGSGEAEPLPQWVEQRGACIDRQAAILSVHAQGDSPPAERARSSRRGDRAL